jgi:serine/threonine-protein kinase HipA
MCQPEFTTGKKYKEHGGPSFAQCYRLVQDISSEPATDALSLLRWQIFNVLAGNSGGHAKNLSPLHLRVNRTRLEPFYDLICTQAIEHIDHHLDFDVGRENSPHAIAPTHWESLADEYDIRPQLVYK